MFKKFLAVALACVMTFSMVGCGEEKKNDSETTPTPAAGSEGTPTAAPTDKPARTDLPADAASFVNFEDGAFGFAKMAYSYAACNLASAISVKDFAGSKALVVTSPKSDNIFSGTQPFVAIDVAALVGDKLGDVDKVQFDIGIDYRGAAFQAVSGSVAVVNGGEAKTAWAVFDESANPKTYTISASGLNDGAYIYFTTNADSPIAATNYDLAIDNLVFYDKDGNVITPDCSKEFAIDGLADSFWLNLVWENGQKAPENEEILFSGVKTAGGWWPDGANSWSFISADHAKGAGYAAYIDPAKFVPGTVITIYYSNPAEEVVEDGNRYKAFPYLRAQAADWDEEKQEWVARNGCADVWSGDDFLNGSDLRNSNYTIVQYTFEQIRDAYNATFGFEGDTEWMEHCTFMGVADRSWKQDIYKVTLGTMPQ